MTDRRRALQTGGGVWLRSPRSADREAFLGLVSRSRRLHHPWVEPPADERAFGAYLARARGNDFVPLLVCRFEDDEIVGVFNLSQIVGGAFKNAYLGYYAFQPHAGRGYMTGGLRLALRHAFSTLRLHRVEANIQPGNSASQALVLRCGFRREGFSPRYLKVAGRWRDHERWAILAEDWRSSAARAN